MSNIKSIDKKLKSIYSELTGKDDVHLFAIAFEPNDEGELVLVANCTPETLRSALFTVMKTQAEFREVFLAVMIDLAHNQNNLYNINSKGDA